MSKQVNTDYLIKLFTERSYAVSRDGIDALNLGMTLSDMIQVISEASGVVYATASQKLKKAKSANTKKARLVLGITEQVAEDQWERHMKTVDVDVPISVDLNPKSADIIGGHWLKSEKE